jgi:tRNA (guanine26-N2/guanine27-N2)-dimethyltransferase
MDKKAVDCIHNNVQKNNITETTETDSKFKVYQYECTQLLYSHLKQFDVIDLDPYGSAIPMIDSAIQSVKNNGLLCVTFTDMPVLCGNYPETTYYKYNSIPYKTSFCHEMAKRIALYSISSSASKYKKVIKPLISFNAEFYIRLFLIVKDSPEDCKSNCMKYGYLHHCRNCQNRYVTPLATVNSTKNSKTQKVSTSIKFNNLTGNTLCDVCDSNMCMSGPYWIDNLHDEDFINSVLTQLDEEKFSYLKYKKRITTFLNGIKEEMPLNNQVFNLDYAQFARDVQVSCPKLSLVKGALESLKYKIIQSYYDPNLFKSDAPVSVIYDVFKKYKKDNYSEDYYKNVKEDSYKYKLLEKEIKVDPIFVNCAETSEEKKSSGNRGKYLPNPLPNWGPKARAKEKKPVEVKTEKK